MTYEPIKNVLDLMSDKALTAILDALNDEVQENGQEAVHLMQAAAENILSKRECNRT